MGGPSAFEHYSYLEMSNISKKRKGVQLDEDKQDKQDEGGLPTDWWTLPICISSRDWIEYYMKHLDQAQHRKGAETKNAYACVLVIPNGISALINGIMMFFWTMLTLRTLWLFLLD